MEYAKFYDVLQSQEPHFNAAGLIQWKGTDVCIDLICPCGYHGHFDGEFLNFYECPKCHEKYAVGMTVKLIGLTEPQSKYIESELRGFNTFDL